MSYIFEDEKQKKIDKIHKETNQLYTEAKEYFGLNGESYKEGIEIIKAMRDFIFKKDTKKLAKMGVTLQQIEKYKVLKKLE